jgi:hypothetical protein
MPWQWNDWRESGWVGKHNIIEPIPQFLKIDIFIINNWSSIQ